MKKVIIICVVSFIIIAIIVTAVFIVVHNRTNKILCDNQNQVDALSKMYEEFINDSINTDESNVELSNSTLRNFVTKKAFEDEQIEKLKEVERNFENAQNDYVLTLKYNSRDKIIILNISSKSNAHIVEQEYLLKVQNGKIEYEEYGNGTVVIS